MPDPKGPELVAWRDPILPPFKLTQRALGMRHQRDHGVVRFARPARFKPLYLVVSCAISAPRPRRSAWARLAAAFAGLRR
jgi:hypothetical protein